MLSTGGLEGTISGEVLRVEPAGFTKLSSLGVGQQRVRVIIALNERPAGLGVGYRLQVRFITASKKKALVIPRFSVLEVPDRSHYVLKVVDGELVRQAIKLGIKNDLQVEVVAGLETEE